MSGRARFWLPLSTHFSRTLRCVSPTPTSTPVPPTPTVTPVPPTVTRVHAGDGRLLAEYAVEKRVFVPIEAIPKRVIKAFLGAEDKNFYSHPGVDFLGVVRATIQNLVNLTAGRRLVGYDGGPAVAGDG